MDPRPRVPRLRSSATGGAERGRCSRAAAREPRSSGIGPAPVRSTRRRTTAARRKTIHRWCNRTCGSCGSTRRGGWSNFIRFPRRSRSTTAPIARGEHWAALFEAAGLTLAAFHEVPSRWSPAAMPMCGAPGKDSCGSSATSPFASRPRLTAAAHLLQRAAAVDEPGRGAPRRRRDDRAAAHDHDRPARSGAAGGGGWPRATASADGPWRSPRRLSDRRGVVRRPSQSRSSSDRASTSAPEDRVPEPGPHAICVTVRVR